MEYENILIVKLSAIGDVIHALPVARALKEDNPAVRITWVVEKPALSLLENNPDIDDIIIFDKARLTSLAGAIRYAVELRRRLRAGKFDLSLDLQGLFKSAAIAFLSGASRRLVYCNARELSYLVSRRICGRYAQGHIVDRYLDVVRYLGVQADKPDFTVAVTPEDGGQARAIAEQAGLDMTKPYVALAPGTNWPNKCWPAFRFAQLSDRLFDNGLVPVVIGGAKDKRLYEEIAAATGIPPVDLTGKTSLKQLAYILRQARAFVGGDTGPMHLAVAAGTRVVALFGPTDPGRNGPYGQGHSVLRTPWECRGCWQRSCPKKLDCLEGITAEQVWDALQKLTDQEEAKSGPVPEKSPAATAGCVQRGVELT
jgi:heptosyltransferase-1